ncbi:MAG: hypothetical protein WBB82_05995 [Limnothrix sp.]
MTSTDSTAKETNSQNSGEQEKSEEKVLCPHCKRTASNGIQCKGICVADDGY